MKSVVISVALLSACGPGARQNNGDDADAAKSVDAPAVNPGSDTGVTPEMSRVYAHSGTTLYRLDTTTFQPMMIGTMDDLGTQSLTDLAIDKNDNMVGITLDSLFSIVPTTAKVTKIKDLSQSGKGFTSLSYVPSNISDPNSADILVAANSSGDVYQFDPNTGDATLLGNYGMKGSDKIVSSGDIIGVRQFGIYATVDVGNGTGDYLAQIDPNNGWKATVRPNPTGYDQIFGLGFWGGTIYGFTKAGDIITIDPDTGVGTKKFGGSIQWYGAGVTTDAPIIF